LPEINLFNCQIFFRPTEQYSDIGGLDKQIQVSSLIKRSLFVTAGLSKYARLFVPGKFLQASLMCASKIGARTRLDRKKLAGTNAPAYFAASVM
jgi:hypothetical protein